MIVGSVQQATSVSKVQHTTLPAMLAITVQKDLKNKQLVLLALTAQR